jgi:hypothetical protein
MSSLLSWSPVALVGAVGRVLALGERFLATLEDAEQSTVLVAHIGPGSSLAELIATLAAGRPSGIAVVGNADRSYAAALALRDGALVGASGTHPLESLAEWTRERSSAIAASDDLDPPRTFVIETALEALRRCEGAGASFALVQGGLQWLDDRLDEDSAPSLDHLLLEHARRSDELPRILAKIGDMDRVVVPLAAPGERAARPTQTRVLADESASDWDFFDDPDPAAEAEWRDAHRVFELCDGMTTIDEVVQRSMIGRFRTLCGMLALVQRSHIVFMTAFAGCDESDDLLESLEDVG